MQIIKIRFQMLKHVMILKLYLHNVGVDARNRSPLLRM